MTASNSWLAGALFLACAYPAAALADPSAAAAPPSEEQVQAARIPYREARELHRQGKVKEALEKALEAYRMASTPVTALEAGQLLVERGRLVEARDIVRSIAAFAVSPRESDKGREARQEAAALASTLDARIPKIAIASAPQGVDVALDGKPIVASDPPAWLGVDPGAHSLVVRSGDRPCATLAITLAEAEARTVDLREATAACHREGAVTATAESPAPAPPPVVMPPSGAEVVPPPASAHHESARSGWRWTGLAVAGAGVAAIGVGGGIALAAKGAYDSVATECPPVGCSSSAYSVRESARSQADAATAVVVGGAIVAASGLLLFVLAPSASSSIAVGAGNVRIAVRF
jgi:hypothetical protein